MITKLFAFQREAVRDLRKKANMAHDNYSRYQFPQVISFQAPTGAGKTIMLSSLIEDIYFGNEDFPEQPDAIFVWLSDSPALNEQSRLKIKNKANRIRPWQLVTVSDNDGFDMREFEDGHVYFLNTQKLSRAGNLIRHSEMRQYTIWETVENTAKRKPEKLYFIIDEAHRGMKGREAGRATSIMQKFIKGSSSDNLSPVPVIIGMSATAERFNALIGSTDSTLHKVKVEPSDVKDSGLLKDRIIINYPQNPSRNDAMSVLQAACDEWREKCRHWESYTAGQNIEGINPVFLIQVQAGSGEKPSATNLDDVIAKIEERLGSRLKENEIVHTFGGFGALTLNGLKVNHVEPEKISDDMRIRVVLFKENLSTGWDCPRAETMMSFRRAEDSTYIAQLLGRMIRTPLQMHVFGDDSLNEVRLFLPYFDRDTVQGVIDGLSGEEGGEIPSCVEGEEIESPQYVTWTVNTVHTPQNVTLPGQILLPIDETPAETPASSLTQGNLPLLLNEPSRFVHNDPEIYPVTDVQIEIAGLDIDRRKITRFINEKAYLNFTVRNRRVNSYLKSLADLANLLTIEGIYSAANEEIRREVTDMIREYSESLRESGQYDSLARQVTEFRLSSKVFDALGGDVSGFRTGDLISLSETDTDRQLREADAKMCGCGFPYYYSRRFMTSENREECKTDCILFSKDESCIDRLMRYAEDKFCALNDNYRVYITSKSDRCNSQYNEIIRDSDIIGRKNFRLPEEYRERLQEDGRVYTNHLLADKNGNARISLNSWEEGLIDEESGRSDFVCWLRNPPRQDWALCIPYRTAGGVKPFYPDFLIVRSDSRLGYVIDILEPHSQGFADNLPKAKGLAQYIAEEHRIKRVQMIRKFRDASGREKFRRLDVAKTAVREAVLNAVNNNDIDRIFDSMSEVTG